MSGQAPDATTWEPNQGGSAAEALRSVLVLGLGAFAYGRERRAAEMFGSMPGVRPVFLVPPFGDGSTERLMQKYGYIYEMAPVGYLGRAHPYWSLKSLLLLPKVNATAFTSYARYCCREVVCLHLFSVLRYLPFLLWVSTINRSRVVLYVGDIPEDRWVYRRLGGMAAFLSDRFIANSQAVADSFVRLGVPREMIVVIHNGVDVPRFRDAPPVPLRDQSASSLDDILVGFVGQISPDKGVGDLLKAASLLKGQSTQFHFVFVGHCADADFREWCSDFITTHDLKDCVSFVGRVDEVERSYTGMDIVAVPTRTPDPAPNVVLEAMAAGKPVIGTRVGGIPELIAEGVTGLLVPPTEPRMLARAILRIATDNDMRQRMAERASQRVRERFDLRRNAALVRREIFDE